LDAANRKVRRKGEHVAENTRTIKGASVFSPLPNRPLISYGNPGEVYDTDRSSMAQSILSVAL